MSKHTDSQPQTDVAARLKQARIDAGFPSARAAALRHNWKYETYTQHENGNRGIVRAAARYAAAFGVTREWLLFGVEKSGDTPGATSTVTLFDIRRDGPDIPRLSLLRMARAAGAGIDRDVWRVSSDTLTGHGFLIGDFLLVDHRDIMEPEEGSTVLIALNDFDTGHATTHLAHYAPPFAIVIGAGHGHIMAHCIDGETVEIKGTVTASWRIFD